MRKISKEVKIAVAVLLSIGLLFWGLNYLKGVDVFSKQRSYYAVYTGVEGLNNSSPVIVNGLKVGSVNEIKFHPRMDGSIIVKFSIESSNFLIPWGSQARISSLDLLGSKAIQIIIPSDFSSNVKEYDYYEGGDTLISSVELSLSEEVNAQIAPLKNRAESLLASIDTAVTVVRVILNKEARSDIKESFSSIKNTFHTFESVSMKLDSLMSIEKTKISAITSNLNSITNNMRNNNENITDILNNFRLITDSLAMSNLTTAVNNTSEALNATAEILRKIDEGEGTMGKLINDDSLYINLESATKSLDRLLIDLEANPKRYVHFSVFGGSDKKKKKKDKKK